MYIVFLVILMARTGFSLLGYDCGGTSFNVTTISLLDVGECHLSVQRPNSTSVYVQLLQKADYNEIPTMSCRIEIDRQIFYCGMHSHVSMVRGGHRKYLADISQQKCAHLHNTGFIEFENFNMITGLVANSTDYRIVNLAGTTNVDGSCKGGHYSDPYGSWDDVVVEASITITLRDYTTPANTKSDYITLRSGIQCKLSDNQCVDEDGANVYWSPLPVDTCNFHSYNVLYQGLANKIFDSESQYPVVYSLTSNDITFGLSRRSDFNICGYTLIQTEHPKLLIVETTKTNPFTKQTKISVNNLDIFAYINSKFVYVEKHVKTQMQKLYNNVLDQKCRLEQQVLKNAISLAQNQPDMFSYSLMKGPGYMAIIAGEVAHIIKCIPTEVTRRPTEDCYLELPVTLMNRSMFLSPKTHTLLNSGTPVDCNPLIPVMYKIKEGWISLTPKPAAVIPPLILEPMMQPTWKYVDAEHLADSGIYSREDLSRLRDHIMFPMESPALLNTFAKTATGHRVPVSSISLKNLLDEEALDSIATSTGRKLWGNFMKFGTASAGLIGIWMLIRLIKLIADTAIHGYALHSVYGWSLHLLGAIFSSITNLLLHMGRRNPHKSSAGNINNASPSNFYVNDDKLNTTTVSASMYPSLTDPNDLGKIIRPTAAPGTIIKDTVIDHSVCTTCNHPH